MNRPHVAALLRVIADSFTEQGRSVAFACDDADTSEEVARSINEIVERLRVRAGEIEAGHN